MPVSPGCHRLRARVATVAVARARCTPVPIAVLLSGVTHRRGDQLPASACYAGADGRNPTSCRRPSDTPLHPHVWRSVPPVMCSSLPHRHCAPLPGPQLRAVCFWPHCLYSVCGVALRQLLRFPLVQPAGVEPAPRPRGLQTQHASAVEESCKFLLHHSSAALYFKTAISTAGVSSVP